MVQNAYKPAASPVEAKGAAPVIAMGMRAFQSADFMGNAEPSLDEMLSDEVMRRVMARDGVAADQLLTLLDDVRSRLR